MILNEVEPLCQQHELSARRRRWLECRGHLGQRQHGQHWGICEQCQHPAATRADIGEVPAAGASFSVSGGISGGGGCRFCCICSSG
jgi:hypothetical protein